MQIGITGIASGGKTVFLSSLIWQLAELESADFSLGDIRLHGFRELPVSRKKAETFPFEKYRDALSRSGRWPDKTTDCFRYACEYHRSDWAKLDVSRLKRLGRFQHNDVQRLELFDFPGERIADAAIAAFDDYAEWSAHILRHFQSNQDYLAAMTSFFNVMERAVADVGADDPALADRIIHAYKLSLAGLIYGYKPLVSPSVFLLDREGGTVQAVTDEAMAGSRHSGLDAEHQFAPLSVSMQQAYPALAKRMAKNYRKYRKELAVPLFNEIGRSQRLLVLVDVPSLLAGGVGRYNDNRQIVLDLFEALRPDSTIGGRLLQMLSFWKAGLERVAFVAAKSDLVHPDDISSGRLESLLRQMTARAKNMLPDVQFGWFVCSAIHSTRPGSKPGMLIGKKSINNPDRKEIEFSVPPLPENWPEDWKAGDFCFASVLPEVSKNLQVPPRHNGLDRVFDFLIR